MSDQEKDLLKAKNEEASRKLIDALKEMIYVEKTWNANFVTKKDNDLDPASILEKYEFNKVVINGVQIIDINIVTAMETKYSKPWVENINCTSVSKNSLPVIFTYYTEPEKLIAFIEIITKYFWQRITDMRSREKEKILKRFGIQ